MNQPLLADETLNLYADILDDLEAVRTANTNRLSQHTRTSIDKDGHQRGGGHMPPGITKLDELLKVVEAELKADKPKCPWPKLPEVWNIAVTVVGIARLEHDAELKLRGVLRHHPLGPWVKAQKGVGEKQAARMLASVRDPYWNEYYDRPRTVSELWQYSGHGDPARSRRRKGQKVQYSPEAKKRVYLVAKSCIRQIEDTCKSPDDGVKHVDGCGCSPYRVVYDQRRRETSERVHTDPCVRCGPSGSPALPGTPWSDGHRDADAVRIMGKEILRDLWDEARRLHTSG